MEGNEKEEEEEEEEIISIPSYHFGCISNKRQNEKLSLPSYLKKMFWFNGRSFLERRK